MFIQITDGRRISVSTTCTQDFTNTYYVILIKEKKQSMNACHVI